MRTGEKQQVSKSHSGAEVWCRMLMLVQASVGRAEVNDRVMEIGEVLAGL